MQDLSVAFGSEQLLNICKLCFHALDRFRKIVQKRVQSLMRLSFLQCKGSEAAFQIIRSLSTDGLEPLVSLCFMGFDGFVYFAEIVKEGCNAAQGPCYRLEVSQTQCLCWSNLRWTN